MEITFFDDDIIKTSKTVFCPECKTKHKIALNDCEISCEICGEGINTEFENRTDTFVWHPSLLF